MQPKVFATKKEFYDTYWFQPTDIVTLLNPLAEDYIFMVEGRHFKIAASAVLDLPGTVANVYLNNMTKIMAQNDDRMDLLSDFNLMAQYFNKLISNKKSTMVEFDPTPAYMKQVPQSAIGQAPETPPWQQPAPAQPAPSAIADTNSTMRDSLQKSDLKENKDVVKEFEQGGNKFKMIVSKDGRQMYYMNGGLTTEATYSKAASML